jgi:hypothetical protein
MIPRNKYKNKNHRHIGFLRGEETGSNKKNSHRNRLTNLRGSIKKVLKRY